MRKALVESLLSLAETDPRVVFLTGDLGFGTFDEFRAKHDERYVNVGVAEAQMITAAAGMALEGCRPIVYSIAPFTTGRPFEHIKISLAYHRLPVVIIGAGGGYTYAGNGPTHHGVDDFALMSIIPGMTVLAPGSPDELKELLPQTMKLNGPSYIRIGKYGEPNYEAMEPAVIGKARLLRSGGKIALVSTSEMAPIVLDAAKKLEPDGIKPVVYQMHTVKPLDTSFLNRISKQVDTMIIVEEASPIGGLCSMVTSYMASLTKQIKIMRMGPPDEIILGNPDREEIRQQCDYDADAIVKMCRKVDSEMVRGSKKDAYACR